MTIHYQLKPLEWRHNKRDGRHYCVGPFCQFVIADCGSGVNLQIVTLDDEEENQRYENPAQAKAAAVTFLKDNLFSAYFDTDCRKIKIRKGWSEDEVKFLKENYHRMTVEKISMALRRRSPAAIRNIVRELGLKKSRIWTEEEIKLLKKHYRNTKNKEISANLINRTPEDISRKARSLRLKKEPIAS